MRFDLDMQSEHKALFLALRSLILSFEGVKEVRKAKITSYVNPAGGLCYMRTDERGVHVGFFRGAQIEDLFGLLTGTGKYMRHLHFKSMNEDAMVYYMLQALEQNKER